MRNISLIITFLLCFAFNASAQSLIAKVNRTEMPVGETFLLTLDYDGDENFAPDFSLLEKDFVIYSAASSVKQNIINNNVVINSRQWQVALSAKSKGALTIPPIKLGTIQSNPIKVNIGEAGAAQKTEQNNDINAFVSSTEAVMDVKAPFVQQQVNYTIKITDTRNIQIDEPQFMEDGANNWLVRMLKKPTVEVIDVGGKPARVINFYYAMFPQKSGTLKTPEVRITGYALEKMKKQRSLGAFNMFAEVFAQRVPVNLSPAQVEVNVRAVPVKGTWWIPAKKLEILSSFEPESPTFKVGEAINRVISIRANGIVETQLPDLNFTQINGIKQYPAKPVSETSVSGDDVEAIKNVSNVYIPSKAGKNVLPEVKLSWFDVRTEKVEEAILPAIEIKVLSADGIKVSEPAQNMPQVSESKEEGIKNIAKENSDYKAYIIAVMAFVLGIVITYLVLRPKTYNINHKKEAIKALNANDFRMAADEIVAWARDVFKDKKVNNLGDVGAVFKNKEFAHELNNLDNMLYSGKAADFDKHKLLTLLKKKLKKSYAKKSGQPLPSLYK